MIILGESHLSRILADYVDYYNNSRAYVSLERNSPTPRAVESSEDGEVIAISQVGGLHHRYTRRGV